MSGESAWDGRVPAAQAAAQEEDLAAYTAATVDDEPPDEHAGMWIDPDTGPPLGEGCWPGELPWEQPEDVPAAWGSAAAEVPVPCLDDVTDHGRPGTGEGGRWFGTGSALDRLEPGPVLAQALHDAYAGGLGRLSDDELAGMMLAGRRLQSQGTAALLAATAELDHRRREAGDPRVAEHTDNEVAILLAFTRAAAQRLLDCADALTRLPATTAALWAGRIDQTKAALIAEETGHLDPALAAAVELLVIEDAPRLTTTMLRRRLRRAVLAADPSAARRRTAKAARQARVELFDERSGGTAGLSGRDLPVAGALAADQRIDSTARALKAAGATATLPQLRAAVFLGLLTGTDPRGFLPSADGADRGSPPGTAGQDGSPSDDAGLAWPGPQTLPLRGSVNLTMPLATWLGASLSPGDIDGFGPATAETCQDLADWIVQSPGTRWCVTVTDKAGHAVGHGCGRRPPPPRGDPARMAAWLARLKIEPIQAGTCTHARQAPGYRIPARLHHLVKIRQRTCSNPICSRPATAGDDDHTVPYDQGGRTCECGLGPACRKCHRTKQAPGWRLEQPSPGILIWHLPNGRSFTATPDVYPT